MVPACPTGGRPPGRAVPPTIGSGHARRFRDPASSCDQRAVGSAALDAVYPDARNPFAFPDLLADEGLKPWTVREVWLQGAAVPGHYVDITKTFPRKIAALRAHESQTGHMEGLEDFLRGWLTRAAAQAGL